jgi:hypothetical protein
MLNHNQELDNPAASDPPHLAALSSVMASWHSCTRQGDRRVIIRFQNGYGAIISKHRRPAGTYEVAPLRFHGGNPDDYGFYFGSHVPDLTWCSTVDEIVSLCEEISRLAPPRST